MMCHLHRIGKQIRYLMFICLEQGEAVIYRSKLAQNHAGLMSVETTHRLRCHAGFGGTEDELQRAPSVSWCLGLRIVPVSAWRLRWPIWSMLLRY